MSGRLTIVWLPDGEREYVLEMPPGSSVGAAERAGDRMRALHTSATVHVFAGGDGDLDVRVVQAPLQVPAEDVTLEQEAERGSQPPLVKEPPRAIHLHAHWGPCPIDGCSWNRPFRGLQD